MEKKKKREVLVTQLYLSLCEPLDCTSVHGIFQHGNYLTMQEPVNYSFNYTAHL